MAAAVPQSGGKKVIVVILRGAMDGMSMLPKIDDPNIHEYRASLIDPNAIPLGGWLRAAFGLANLRGKGMYKAGQAAFVPATAGPYRERSHFEAQDLLESGSVKSVTSDGWLNRALQKALSARYLRRVDRADAAADRCAALRKAHVASWSPAYPAGSERRHAQPADGALRQGSGAESVAGRRSAGLRRQASLPARPRRANDTPAWAEAAAGRGGPGQVRAGMLSAAGCFPSQTDGPEIAVVSLDGWDTHAAQNQALQQRFLALDIGLKALKDTLGETWNKIKPWSGSHGVRPHGARQWRAAAPDHGTGGTGDPRGRRDRRRGRIVQATGRASRRPRCSRTATSRRRRMTRAAVFKGVFAARLSSAGRRPIWRARSVSR